MMWSESDVGDGPSRHWREREGEKKVVYEFNYESLISFLSSNFKFSRSMVLDRCILHIYPFIIIDLF